MWFPKMGKFAPVTLGHMRSHGCRDLLISCNSCQHSTATCVGHLPDHKVISSLGNQSVCTRCGHVGVEVRPLWGTLANQEVSHAQPVSNNSRFPYSLSS